MRMASFTAIGAMATGKSIGSRFLNSSTNLGSISGLSGFSSSSTSMTGGYASFLSDEWSFFLTFLDRGRGGLSAVMALVDGSRVS